MPHRPQRHPAPPSRLTTAGRIGIVVVLAGVVLARTRLLTRDGFDGADEDMSIRVAPTSALGPTPAESAPAVPTPSLPTHATPTRAMPTPAVSTGAASTPVAQGPSEDAGDRFVSEVIVHGHVVRAWLRPRPDLGIEQPIVTIRADGVPETVLEWTRLDDRTGTDVTGDARSEIVVEHDTGGMGCCWSLEIFQVDSTPHALRTILALPLSRCRGRLEDLDGDGADEVLTCDPTITDALCSAAGSGDPPVVLRFVDGKGYVPATPAFADDLPATVDVPIDVAAAGGTGSAGLCAVLPASLDALYRGRSADAWAILDGIATPATTRATIERLAAASPLFVAASP